MGRARKRMFDGGEGRTVRVGTKRGADAGTMGRKIGARKGAGQEGPDGLSAPVLRRAVRFAKVKGRLFPGRGGRLRCFCGQRAEVRRLIRAVEQSSLMELPVSFIVS